MKRQICGLSKLLVKKMLQLPTFKFLWKTTLNLKISKLDIKCTNSDKIRTTCTKNIKDPSLVQCCISKPFGNIKKPNTYVFME